MRRLLDHSGDRGFALEMERQRLATQVVYAMLILGILWYFGFPLFR